MSRLLERVKMPNRGFSNNRGYGRSNSYDSHDGAGQYRNDRGGRDDRSQYRGQNQNRGYNNRNGYESHGRFNGQRKAPNQHDYSVVPNLVYVTNTLRINMGKITKVSYSRMSGEWTFFAPNGSNKVINAADINEGSKEILSKYYYLATVEDTDKVITKINVNAIVKAKLDKASDIWYIDMAGGDKLEVRDSIINAATRGYDFGGTSMVTVVDNGVETYRINKYFILMVDRKTETDGLTFVVSYNDRDSGDDSFHNSELTDAGVSTLARYRKSVNQEDPQEA